MLLSGNKLDHLKIENITCGNSYILTPYYKKKPTKVIRHSYIVVRHNVWCAYYHGIIKPCYHNYHIAY